MLLYLMVTKYIVDPFGRTVLMVLPLLFIVHIARPVTSVIVADLSPGADIVMAPFDGFGYTPANETLLTFTLSNTCSLKQLR